VEKVDQLRGLFPATCQLYRPRNTRNYSTGQTWCQPPPSDNQQHLTILIARSRKEMEVSGSENIVLETRYHLLLNTWRRLDHILHTLLLQNSNTKCLLDPPKLYYLCHLTTPPLSHHNAPRFQLRATLLFDQMGILMD
jgi:hypothetical protein